MKITWLGQSGYLLEGDGQRLVLDPFFSDIVERKQGLRRLLPPPCTIASLTPDALLITHDHLDHYDPETVVAIMAMFPACRLIGPASVMAHGAQAGLAADRLVPLASGETRHSGRVAISATPARHSDPSSVGLLIQFATDLLWFSGDTLYFPELSPQVLRLARRSPDIALVCINGRLNNMCAVDAVRLMAELQPRLAVPTHYGMFAENTADPSGFLTACALLNQPAAVLCHGRAEESASLLAGAAGLQTPQARL